MAVNSVGLIDLDPSVCVCDASLTSCFSADQNIKRESGRKVQTGNISAAKVSFYWNTGH